MKDRLAQLIYTSRSASGFGLQMLGDILDTARLANPRHGVTGFLAFGGQTFLQLLEGPTFAVNRLYARILRDPRHTDCELISYRPIEEREFASWSMGFCDLGRLLSSPTSDWARRFGDLRRFDPRALEADECVLLLGALSAHAHAVDVPRVNG